MKKVLSFGLAIVLVVTLLPFSFPPSAEAATELDRGFITLDEDHSNIAPGVEQTISTVRKNYNKQQMVYYAMTVDTGSGYNHICLNYRNNDWDAYKNGDYGLQEVTKQMDAAQQKHADDPNYTVVGGINGTGYDMSNGNSNGYILVSEGKEINKVANQSFFAIRKDGTAFIGWDQAAYDNAMTSDNPIVEAIGIFHNPLVKNSQIVARNDHATNPDCNARTAIGVTADSDVVMLVVDGKQAPTSEGCDMYELAEILKNAGCVDAFNLDGGGSSTFVSRPEGESTYRVVNKPCDGSPRAVASSLYVASTYVSDERFDHAALTADADYITPNGTVNLTAKGVNPAGAPFEIPEDVTWSCTDGAGTLTSNGKTAVFTADTDLTSEDTEVVVSMTRGEKEVGKTTIHVVKPNVFNLKHDTYPVPFGKSIAFDVYAAYKNTDGTSEHEVALHDEDVTYSVEPAELGEVKGNVFTARSGEEEGTVSGTVTATLTCNSQTDEAEMTLGKGSEYVFDFEKDGEQEVGYFEGYVSAGSGVTITQELASEADGGHVRSGEHSMRVTIDYSDIESNVTSESGSACNIHLTYKGANKELKGAVGFGMWIWVPDEERYHGLAPLFGGAPERDSYQKEGINYDEGHWEWVHIDSTVVAGIKDFTIKPENYLGIWLYRSDNPKIYDNLANKLVFYVDDVMVDYSLVTPDRDAPTIESVKTGASDVLIRDEVYDFGNVNKVSFSAPAQEVEDMNATGIDPKSAKAYIDGNELEDVRFENGQIVTAPVTVADGVHTLKLYISDVEGNTTNQTRQFRVSANSGIPTIQVVPQDPEANRMLSGSVYYMDVNATDISKVQEVEMTLDLFNNADWELDHTDVNPKFTMEKPVIDPYENIATLKFTRTDEPWREGDTETIASLPIRLWGRTYDSEDAPSWEVTTVKDGNSSVSYRFSPRTLELDVDRGKLTLVDDSAGDALPAFGMEHLKVETELFGTPDQVLAENPDMKGWHNHYSGRFEYEELPDVEPTCTEKGYRGRKICSVCHSPVTNEDWGTVLDVIDHDYQIDPRRKAEMHQVWADLRGREGRQNLQGWPRPHRLAGR